MLENLTPLLHLKREPLTFQVHGLKGNIEEIIVLILFYFTCSVYEHYICLPLVFLIFHYSSTGAIEQRKLFFLSATFALWPWSQLRGSGFSEVFEERSWGPSS